MASQDMWEVKSGRLLVGETGSLGHWEILGALGEVVVKFDDLFLVDEFLE